MSIFASLSTETISLPGDEAHAVTIRTLTGREVEDAQAEHLKTLISGRSARGWAGSFVRKIAEGTATDADAHALLRDPLAGFDLDTVVTKGLVSWTYERAIDPAAIADLTDAAREYIATAIMRRTRPGLFADAAEIQKNG